MLPENLIEQTVSRFPRFARGTICVDTLEKGGSDRKYYRIRVTDEHSLILMRYGDSREENRHYCAIAKFLAGLGVHVPEIYHHDEQERLIWLEDLGQTDLWAYRGREWETLRGYYGLTLDEMAALHTREATILGAKADAIRTNTLSAALAFNTVAAAQAESLRIEMDAAARAALFTNQIPAYLAAPSVYLQRARMEAFDRGTANARKYLRLATNTHDVLILDLEDKVRPDILDTITVQPPKTPLPGK